MHPNYYPILTKTYSSPELLLLIPLVGTDNHNFNHHPNNCISTVSTINNKPDDTCSKIDKQIQIFKFSDFQINCNSNPILTPKSKKDYSNKNNNDEYAASVPFPHWPFNSNLQVDFIHIDKPFSDTSTHNQDDK